MARPWTPLGRKKERLKLRQMLFGNFFMLQPVAIESILKRDLVGCLLNQGFYRWHINKICHLRNPPPPQEVDWVEGSFQQVANLVDALKTDQ